MLSTNQISLILQKCMKSKSLKPCEQIHALTLTSNINMNILSLSSKLIATYASCNDLASAKSLLHQTPNPNVFAFNWLISSSAFSGFFQESLGYLSSLHKSRSAHTYPNNHTFAQVLKACVGLLDMKIGEQIHSMICKMGMNSDLLVCNALVDMYSKCGDVILARKLFDEMPDRDVASWTSMISGYANVNNVKESTAMLEKMSLEGLDPNEFTWNAIISAHARAGDIDNAFGFFARMCDKGLIPDIVTGNAMISGFVESQRFNEALKLFQDMLVGGIRPNQTTITALLPVCVMLDSISKGKEIHGFIYRTVLYVNVYVASALIDMYSKCGTVEQARNVFDSIPVKNVASWNTMIGCYGRHGMVDNAIELFDTMQGQDIQANEVTLISVLSVCVHGGLLEKGLELFWSMKEKYGVEPGKEHYGCVVDLLCRSGKMDEAYEIIREMPIEVTDSIIGAFFNGCKIYGKRDLARKMAEFLKMELKKPGGFVTLSNIYASDGEWLEVENVRKVMKHKNVQKIPGLSSI